MHVVSGCKGSECQHDVEHVNIYVKKGQIENQELHTVEVKERLSQRFVLHHTGMNYGWNGIVE